MAIFLLFYAFNASATHRTAYFYKNIHPKKTSRIVSLAPVSTEIVTALGSSEKLVGITRFCVKPTGRNVAVVGGFSDPQLEAILAVKPDLVILMPNMGSQKIIDQLHKQHIPVLIAFGETLGELRNLIQFMGQTLDKESVATQALKIFNQKLAQLEPKTKSKKNPSVVVVVGTNPLVVASQKTFIGELLDLLKMRQPVAKEGRAWPIWSLETLVHYHPDIIIHLQGQEALAQLKKDLAPIMQHPKMRNTKLLASKNAILQSVGIHLPDEAAVFKQLIEKAV